MRALSSYRIVLPEHQLNVEDLRAFRLQRFEARLEALGARNQMVLQLGHAALAGKLQARLVLVLGEAGALGVEQQLQRNELISDHHSAKSTPNQQQQQKTYPTRIGIVENLVQLLVDDLAVLLERALQKDELGELPAPANRRYVLDHLLRVRLAVAQHEALLAEDPAEQPVNLVRVVHQQQRVLLQAAVAQHLRIDVDVQLRVGPPVGQTNDL